jgi:Asp-tRNA(Asn)/Glu-tRNA(Gln) amidotransferase B subunit
MARIVSLSRRAESRCEESLTIKKDEDVSAALDMTGMVEVMKLFKGKANPQLAGEILERKLKK